MKLRGIPDYESFDFEIEEPHQDAIERRLVEQLLHRKGKWAVDLGCGYGRLTPLISERYENVILMDHSIRGLERAGDSVGSANKFLVACDVRKPPVVDSSVDLILMIRVFHHMEHPEEPLRSISRKLRFGGEIILNFNNTFSIPFMLAGFANKLFHTDLLNFRMNIFSKLPQMATESGCKRPIYFCPFSFVNTLLKAQALELGDMIGVGFMHNSLIERKTEIINLERLTSFELKFGRLPVVRTLSPDIFVHCRNTRSDGNNSNVNNSFDILCCPRCSGRLIGGNGSVKCFRCRSQYPYFGNILDLRTDVSMD